MDRKIFFLKLSFIIGVIADFLIAVNWFLISAGYKIPSIISSYYAVGADYRFAMYIAAMFMLGWTVLLGWGVLKPVERKGLLIITSGLLLLSIIIELTIYQNVLNGPLFRAGIIARMLLIIKFSFSYFYSLKK